MRATKYVWLLVLAVVAFTGTYLVTQPGSGSEAESQDPPSSQDTERPNPAEDEPPADHDAPGPPVHGAASWRAAAESFAVAFTNTTGGKDAWRTRLRPWVAADLYDAYGLTDLAVVPTSRFDRITTSKTVGGETPTVVATLDYADELVLQATVSQDPTTERWVVVTAGPAGGPS